MMACRKTAYTRDCRKSQFVILGCNGERTRSMKMKVSSEAAKGVSSVKRRHSCSST